MKFIIKLFVCVALWGWLLACILLKDNTENSETIPVKTIKLDTIDSTRYRIYVNTIEGYGLQGNDVEYYENYLKDHSEYLDHNMGE